MLIPRILKNDVLKGIALLATAPCLAMGLPQNLRDPDLPPVVVPGYNVASPGNEGVFDLALPVQPERARNVFFPQLASFILPGFDQWIEGQYAAAGLYSGLGVASIIATQAYVNDGVVSGGIDAIDNRLRGAMLATQFYMVAGSFSAYSSFRSAARSQQTASAKYLFLKHEEDVGELLLAPFRFGYLAKPSTFVPLLVAGALMSSGDWSGKVSFGADDAFFAGAFSYNAGTNEEALFRGWLMPALYEGTEHRFLANAIQATLFAAAHISTDNPFPVFQLAMGLYLGHMVQRNEWTLSQAVFTHVWWDVVVFSMAYAQGRVGARGSSRRAMLWFPPVILTF